MESHKIPWFQTTRVEVMGSITKPIPTGSVPLAPWVSARPWAYPPLGLSIWG